MRAKLLGLGLASVCVSLFGADYNPVQLTPNSFNQDIVIEKGAQPPLANYTTVTVDQGTNNYQNTFFERGYIAANPWLGVAPHGTTFQGADHPTWTYLMPPDYTTNNCAYIGSSFSPTVFGGSVSNINVAATTVYVTDPTQPSASVGSLSFLVAAGASSGTAMPVNYTVHHQDGSSEQGTFTATDWFNGSAAYAYVAEGRVSVDGGQNPINTLNSLTQTKIFHFETGVNPGSPVTSVDFSLPGSGATAPYRVCIFGMSGSQDGGTTFQPIPIYGFNQKCIVPASAPCDYVQGTTVVLDTSGPGNGAGGGTALYEQGFGCTNYADQGFNGAANGTFPLGGTYGPAPYLSNGSTTNTSQTPVYTGLPHPNALITTTANHVWQMPPTYVGNCCVFVGNYAAGNMTNAWGYASPNFHDNVNVTIPVQPVPLYGLSFLDVAANGPAVINYVLHYDNGSVQGGNFSVTDWTSTSTPADFICDGQVAPDGPGLSNVGAGKSRLFHQDFNVTNQSAHVTSITFSYNSGGRAAILAISAQTNSGGSFYPLGPGTGGALWSGFNADCVVEASQPLFPAGLFNATSATMDLGVRNGNWTWFEQGWVTNGIYSALGMPPSGSVITSLQSASRHYQLGNYSANNAILLDTNLHRSALVTPQTPTPSTAVALLTAGASIGAGNRMTNYCILLHADGSSETNLFLGYDWFDTSFAPAYIPYTRGDTRVGTASNVSASQTATNLTPRLFESFFQVNNTSSPITNILLTAATNVTGGANWTTYVLAVSANQGAVQPIVWYTVESINNGPGVTAATIFEGSNVVFNAAIPVTGSQPMSFQWQFSPDFGSTWVNLTDGGTISGSTTPSLTNTSVTWSNAGQYRLTVCNAAGCATNSSASLTIYSTLADVTQPTDPVLAFQPNGGSSPTAEGVANAIDNLIGTNRDAKYLNFGANGKAPFAGPIGLVVTPAMGKTTLSALRVYTANDAAERDPVDYGLEGSNDGGTTWAPIAGGPLHLPATRNGPGWGPSVPPNVMTQAVQEVHFPNTTGYFSYRLSFTNAANNTTANSIQVGEVELLGVATRAAVVITRDVVTNVQVFAGAAPTLSIEAVGYPGPLVYQWYSNNVPVPGANGASYTVSNVQASASGSTFYCVVSNSVPPAATSSTALLTVVPAPVGGYATSIMGDSPMAWYRLDEGPDDGRHGGNNGVTTYDYWGGHNGFYTNAVLAQPGFSGTDPDTAAYFGQSAGNYLPIGGPVDSCVEGIPGVDFSLTNASAALSVEAWVMLDPVLAASSVFSAGLVTKGYGNGGEQFNLDCGGGSAAAPAFRFFIRDSRGTTHLVNAKVGPEPGVWHHVVGVVDEAHSNVLFYVDGLLNGSAAVSPTNGILTSALPVTLGGRSQNSATNHNFTFYGSVDEVAIYSHALSSNQVMNHFLAAGIAPRFLAQPTNAAVSEGSTAQFYAPFYGSSTLSAQWYQSADGVNFTPIGGQTTSTLTLANVSQAMSGYQYYLQVSNPYGTTNSAVAMLTVQSGPPVSQQCPPANVVVYAGRSLTLSSQFGGTLPITYQWYKSTDGGATYSAVVNNSRISGATSNVLSIANAGLNDSGLYQVQASNAYSGGGGTPCSLANVTVETVVDFNLAGAGWNLQVNDSLGVGGRGFDGTTPDAVLKLTDSQNSEATSAFYSQPLYVGAFKANFTYQESGPLANVGADGASFCIQNDPRGPAAVGGGGGSLGVSGITPSWEMCLNIFPSNLPGYSFNTGGAHGPYNPTSPVDIHSQDPIQIGLVYDGTTLSLSMTDAVASATFYTSTTVNLPATLRTNVAWVGFTGATGGDNCTQTISNFSFVPVATLSAQGTATNTIVLSWPAAIGGYALLEETGLVPGAWSASPAVVNQIGSQFQAVVAPSGGSKFYRLVLQPGQ